MIKKNQWLIVPIIFILSCNNEKTKDKPVAKNTVKGHAGHNTTVSNNYCDSLNNGLIAADTLKGSPARTAMAAINGTHVHIKYSSPGVKERIVWGGVVPYDKVWVTGAHKATVVQFSGETEINGKKIPAGQYALLTIPGKEKWIVILNSRYDQHLADEYNEREDIIRMEVNPELHNMTQRLTYAVNKLKNNSGEIVIQWEKLLIRVPFKTI